MDWLFVIGFILFGITLIVIEIIFVPGTTVVGIGGILSAAYGIYLSFSNFGPITGTITLIITAVVCISALIYSLKSNAWDRFSLKNTMQGKVNEEFAQKLEVGDEGESASSIKPIGKAIFNDKVIEVRSLGGWIGEKEKIKIIKIDQNRIFVEPLNKS